MSFPSLGADLSDFEWEMPTPESYEKDMRLMGVLDDSSHVRVPEPPPDNRPDLRSVAGQMWPELASHDAAADAGQLAPHDLEWT